MTNDQRRRGGSWTWLLGLPLLALLLIPLAALIARAPVHLLHHYLSDSDTLTIITLSLTTSTAATLLAVVFGTPLALVMTRRQFAGRRVLEVLMEMPIVLPPTVAGLALLLAFGRFGLLGPWLDKLGIEVAFTTAAVIMAQAFVASPFYIKAAMVSLSEVDATLEDSARNLGASGTRVFWRVTLPLAWRGILGGATLCWARALGEFGATIIFAGNFPGRSRTMPIAVYLGFETDLKQAIALAVILMTCSFAGLMLVRSLLEKRHPLVK
ncbi:MAG: molybdate ABC transporter permease subunit [Planctomycetes bacterium]|nr:molybdate ABC transporter permease subunit [Planctomycetota bacterium]